MNRIELQKKYGVYVLLFLSSYLVLIVLLILGGMFLSKGITFLGAFLLCLAALCFIVPLIAFIFATRKYKPLIYEAITKEIREKLTNIDGKKIFMSEDNKEIEFEEGSFRYGNRSFRYEDFLFLITAQNKAKLLSNIVELELLMFSGELAICVPLNGDLLSEIKRDNINLTNEADLQYLIDNTHVAVKQLMRRAAFQTIQTKTPLSFAKNEEEKKIAKRANAKQIIFGTIILLIIMGINILFVWLGETEEGLQISDTLTFNLGFKLVLSGIILGLALIKSSNIRWIGKLIFILYLIIYWLGIAYLPPRFNVLITFVFAFIFVAVGILVLDKKTYKNRPLNRLIGFGMFLFVLLIYNTTDFNIIDLGGIGIISVIIAGILSLASIFAIIIYNRRKMAAGEMTKKSATITAITLPLCTMLFGFLIFFFGMQNLNYCLDTSEPELIVEEVVELKKGGSNSSDSAVVIIDGNKVEIPIPTSLYFELEVGDSIRVSLYAGGLGFEYFILE